MSNGFGYSALHNLKCLLTSLYSLAMKEDIINNNYATFIELLEKEEINATRFTDIQLEFIRQNVGKIPYTNYIYAIEEAEYYKTYGQVKIGQLIKNNLLVE